MTVHNLVSVYKWQLVAIFMNLVVCSINLTLERCNKDAMDFDNENIPSHFITFSLRNLFHGSIKTVLE